MALPPFPCPACLASGLTPDQAVRKVAYNPGKYQRDGRDTACCFRLGHHASNGNCVYFVDTGQPVGSINPSCWDYIDRQAPPPPSVWGIQSSVLADMGFRGVTLDFATHLRAKYPDIAKRMFPSRVLSQAVVNKDPIILAPYYGAKTGICGYECRIDAPKFKPRPGDSGDAPGGKAIVTLGDTGVFIPNPFPSPNPSIGVIVEGTKVTARLTADALCHGAKQYAFLGVSAGVNIDTLLATTRLYFPGITLMVVGDRDKPGTDLVRKLTSHGVIPILASGCHGVDLADEEDDYLRWESFEAGVEAGLSTAQKHDEPGSDNREAVIAMLREEGLAFDDDDGRLKILKRPTAVRTILANDGVYAGVLRRNEMGLRDYLADSEIREDTFADIEYDLDRRYGFNVSHPMLQRQVIAICGEHAFHPVKEYLSTCPPWDRVDRFDRVLTEVLKAPPSAINRPMLDCFFRGSVARVLAPGCKMDTALTLKSEAQGIFKTSFFRVLCAGIPGAFLEGHTDIHSKDGLLAMHTGWMAELGEIDRVTKQKNAEDLKNFMSRSTDTIRPPYARRDMPMARRFVMVGTTNQSAFLNDPTGHRRFHVLETGVEPYDLHLLEQLVPQLWAQALHEYNQGLRWWLAGDENYLHAELMKGFEVDEPWDGLVAQAVESLSIPRDGIPLSTILKAMEVISSQQTTGAGARVGAILRSMGWVRNLNQVRINGELLRLWRPPQDIRAAEC